MSGAGERSRKPEEIIKEIKRLVADGVVEVMLLGQNVNSLWQKSGDAHDLLQSVLREIEKIPGLERIRFMTSHPKDLSDELIQVMAESQKICRHLHLPPSVRELPHFKGDEPKIYQGAVSGSGGKDQGRCSGYFPDDGYYRGLSRRDRRGF